MSRAARLIALMEALRRRRRAVSAETLADELEVSVRTIYRDVATLVAEGATIEGEAGFGYVLKPGTFLPPLMFSEDEADALMLGLRLVAQRGDEELQDAAENALAKIAAVLPEEQEDAAATSGLLAGPSRSEPRHLTVIRRAMRAEESIQLSYTDNKAKGTERVVWPVAIGFFDYGEVLAAWCETRGAFRHFLLERIAGAEPTGRRYPRRRRILLAEWRALEELG